MKPIKVLALAVPVALLIGSTAAPSLAQQPRSSFDQFGCRLDTDELVRNGVIAEGVFEEGVALVGFVTSKNCPGSQQNPSIQMTCEFELDPDPGLALETRNFTCEISGAQCGLNSTFLASNRRLTFEPGPAPGEPGRAAMRCSRNVD